LIFQQKKYKVHMNKMIIIGHITLIQLNTSQSD